MLKYTLNILNVGKHNKIGLRHAIYTYTAFCYSPGRFMSPSIVTLLR